MSDKVVWLAGAPANVDRPQPEQSCIEMLEAVLEEARAGHIRGATMVVLRDDNTGSYYFGGHIGGFSMLGAATCMMQCLTELVRPDLEDA